MNALSTAHPVEDCDASDDLASTVIEALLQYPLVATDLDGTILLWNEAAQRTYGYAAAEVVGQRNASVLCSAEDAQRGVPHKILAAALADGQWQGLLVRQRKDGESFEEFVTVTPRHDAARRAVGFLLMSQAPQSRAMRRDESPRTHAAEQEGSHLLTPTFLASLSHELRTPLTAIIGFTGALLMRLAGPLRAEQADQLACVERNASHLLALIDDLLDLINIETGQLSLRPERVSCAAVMRELAGTLQPVAAAKGLRWIVVMPANDVTLHTDERAYTKILRRLIHNAIKFTSQGEICVEVAERQARGRRWLDVRVSDTGIGIDEEDQVRLLHAPTAYDTSQIGTHEGLRLGLYLNRKLAARLDGRLEVQSRAGCGSSFTFSVPLEQP